VLAVSTIRSAGTATACSVIHSEIARRADIAYGTFFNHFPSKLHLLRELSDLALRDLFENVEELRKQPGSFAEHLIALFESSAERAERVGRALRAGIVWVNTFLVRDLTAPFGGIGISGLGREGGDYALDFHSDLKTLQIADGTTR